MIVVDWGTSSFRAFRIARDGAILDRRGSPRGIMHVKDGRFAETLREEIGDWLKAGESRVLLAGMKAPPNFGREYAQDYEAVFPRLAEKHGALLYPFFLDGVALDPAFSQPDGLHPTASGIAEVVRRILPDVETLIQRISQRKTAAN